MFSRIARLWQAPLRRQAYGIYAQLVEQAREPHFYTDCGVPDTLDGRFEMILLHMFLYQRSPVQDKTEAQLRRMVAEAFFEDMDRSLREIGISDTGVGKRIKAMARAYFGRLKVYEEALADDALLAQALLRNVYATVGEVPLDTVNRLVAYVRRRLKVASGAEFA